MKINFTISLLDLEGNEIVYKNGKLTLKDTALVALLGQVTGDDTVSVDTKVRCYELAVKITATPDCMMTPEELAFIKGRIGQAWTPLIVGRSFEILNGTL
jgi:hypothetical protein